MMFDSFADPLRSPNNMSPRSDLTSLTSPGSTPERHHRKVLLSIHSTSSTEDNDKIKKWKSDERPMLNVRNIHPAQTKPASLNAQRQLTITTNGHNVHKTLEEEQAERLRRDIELEERSIAKLERLAEELPNLTRVGRRMHHIVHQSQPETVESPTKNSTSGSSKVIVTLQNQIDALKRKLTEVTEVANEGFREKGALRKKLELMDSSVESVKHQNKMLNQLIDRKERRISELESASDTQQYALKSRERSETRLTIENQQLNQELESKKQEVSRLELNYKTLVDSTRSLKIKHEEDVEEIKKHLNHLTSSNKKDKSRIMMIESDLSRQKIEYKSLKKLYRENEISQKERFEKLNRLFTAMKRSVDDKDDTIEEKMADILEEFAKFKSYDPSKHI